MADHASAREAGERIAALLEELRTTSSPRVWERVDELLRATLDLYGRGLARVVELASGPQPAGLQARLLEDPLLSTLLILHGLHPLGAAERVARALERVNRAAGMESGGVELVGLDDAGLLRLRIRPAGRARRAALQALRAAAVSAAEEAAPEAARIEVEGVEAEGPAAGLVQLGPPRPREPGGAPRPEATP